jgi:6-phosphogluconolactonase (cycloisomerase 2 family)
VDSSGKFVYVPSYTSDTISAFAINPTTGALTALPTLTGRDGNIVLAMTSGTTPVANTPKFAYAANAGGTVSAYTINATTGALTHVGTDVAAGTGPASVSADPFGRFAYVANAGGDVSAYTITGTGALSQINCGGGGCVGANFAAGSNPKSVTVDPSGRFVYVANAGDGVNPSTVSAYAIDSGSGALAAIGSPLAAGINPISVSVDASGRFAYVVNSISNDISAYSVDATSGTLTPIDRDPVTTPLVVDNFPAGTTPRAIGVDPFGRFAYVVNAGTPGTISAYAIDTRSPTVVGAIPGALTAIGSPVATGTNPVSVTVDASGKFVYVANAGGGVSRYTIASDGTLTSNGTTTAGSGPASVTVAASTGSTVSGSHEFAYVANSGAGTVSGFSVNDSSGALTSVGAAAGAGSTPSSVTTTGTIQ